MKIGRRFVFIRFVLILTGWLLSASPLEAQTPAPGWTLDIFAVDVSTVSGGEALAADLTKGDLFIKSLQDPSGLNVQLTLAPVAADGNFTILGTFPFLRNSDLSGIAIDPVTGGIIIADESGRRIALIDLSTLSVTTLFDIPWVMNPFTNGTGQQQYAPDPANPNILYFWDSTLSKLFSLDRDTNTLLELLALDQGTPIGRHFSTFVNDIVFDTSTGTLLLTDGLSRKILEVDPSTSPASVTTLFSGLSTSPRGITLNPLTQEIFVTDFNSLFVGPRSGGLLSPVSTAFTFLADITIGNATTGNSLSLFAVDKTVDTVYEIRKRGLTDVRVIDTISSTNIDLDLTSFSKQPDSITVESDRTVIEWQFDAFSIGQIENLSFDVILKNPFPGEARLVSHQVELLYTDVNGNPVRTELGPQFVNVLASAFTTAVSTDKVQYTANENVLIDLSITNLSGFARTVDAVVEIEDSLGNPVQTVTTLPAQTFLAGETKGFPGLLFNTGNTFSGDYRAHVRLIEAGVEVGEATADFTILPVIQAASTIVSDKIAYSSNEVVTLSTSVVSQSPNAVLKNLAATVTVVDSLGTPLLTETRLLADLLPEARIAFDAFFNTATLPAGLYTATVRVNTNGAPLTTDSTRFEIISSLEQANALSGTLTVVPNSILETESTTLTYTIQNTGNEFDLPLISIEIFVVDPETGLAVRTLTDQTALNGREIFTNTILFDSNGLAPKPYLVVLTGTTAGVTQTLDSAGLQINPIPNTAPTADAGPDQLGFVGQPIALDGTLSADPDGDPLTFSWDFVSTPAASQLTQASLTNGESPTPTFIPDVEGIYLLSLVVNDGLIDSAVDTVSVFINPAPAVEIHPEVINLKSHGASKSITGVLTSPVLSAFEFFTAADGVTVTATFGLENRYIDKNGETVVFTIPAEDDPGDDTVVPVDADGNGAVDLHQLTLKFNRDLIIAGFKNANLQLRITQPTELVSTVIGTVGGIDLTIGSDTNMVISPPAVTFGEKPHK